MNLPVFPNLDVEAPASVENDGLLPGNNLVFIRLEPTAEVGSGVNFSPTLHDYKSVCSAAL
jgi:hypothetical protein